MRPKLLNSISQYKGYVKKNIKKFHFIMLEIVISSLLEKCKFVLVYYFNRYSSLLLSGKLFGALRAETMSPFAQ